MRRSEIARLCELAYRCHDCTEEEHCEKVSQELSPKGFLARCFGSESTEGFIVYHPVKKYAFVVFRGTEAELSDIVHDLLVWPTENLRGPGRVHGGVQYALDSVWTQIKSLLVELEVVCVDICGHSLGGMLATLAACWCYSELPNCVVSNIYTFGSPPIGDRVFAGSLSFTLRGKICNVVNFVDVVPRLLSPRLMGFRLAGHVCYMTGERQVILQSPTVFRRVKDVLLQNLKALWGFVRHGSLSAPGIECHSITRYRESLEAAGE